MDSLSHIPETLATLNVKGRTVAFHDLKALEALRTAVRRSRSTSRSPRSG